MTSLHQHHLQYSLFSAALYKLLLELSKVECEIVDDINLFKLFLQSLTVTNFELILKCFLVLIVISLIVNILTVFVIFLLQILFLKC